MSSETVNELTHLQAIRYVGEGMYRSYRSFDWVNSNGDSRHMGSGVLFRVMSPLVHDEVEIRRRDRNEPFSGLAEEVRQELAAQDLVADPEPVDAELIGYVLNAANDAGAGWTQRMIIREVLTQPEKFRATFVDGKLNSVYFFASSEVRPEPVAMSWHERLTNGLEIP